MINITNISVMVPTITEITLLEKYRCMEHGWKLQIFMMQPNAVNSTLPVQNTYFNKKIFKDPSRLYETFVPNFLISLPCLFT
jgi:hypothetical protein